MVVLTQVAENATKKRAMEDIASEEEEALLVSPKKRKTKPEKRVSIVETKQEPLTSKKRKRDKSISDDKDSKPKDWKCSCGVENFFRRITCKKCKKRNPDTNVENDWPCAKKSCGKSNYENRSFCYACRTLKDGSGIQSFKGDWECKCGTINFVQKIKCRECDKDPNKPVVVQKPKPTIKPEKPTIKPEKPTSKPHTKSDKTSDDKGNVTLEDTLKLSFNDSAMNNATDVDESVSHDPDKKAFKWNKLIKMCINATTNKHISDKKLCKVLLPQYVNVTGEDITVEDFKTKLQGRIDKSTLFTCDDGRVTLCS